ncbi:hypothetical protein B0H14DRAFT_2618472 [Mycena olivaceomarginata]|nr:hypothetical protein B0H14DRAFT_2618472 [Mycena olivaceomarginata]
MILTVAAWHSIEAEAHNPPAHFTSPLGQSIYKLSRSGLVDDSRTNVVIVITKSMSSMDEFNDFSKSERDSQWMIEAGRQRGIIVAFSAKFSLGPVFVENTGPTSAEYPILPNGESSHQNLFDAIRRVIKTPGPNETHDLAGMRALGAITS